MPADSVFDLRDWPDCRSRTTERPAWREAVSIQADELSVAHRSFSGLPRGWRRP